MKKLMFGLAMVASLLTNAGTVRWELWDDDASATTDYTVYLMEGSLTTGSKIDAITDANSAKTYVASAADSGLMDHTDALYASGETGAYTSGQRDFYALIFNGDSIDTATDYKVVGSWTANVPGSGFTTFSNDITGMTTSGWSSISGSTPTPPTPGPSGIPEPTSGLLLLVGGAMLALRRKQK